MPTTWYFDGAGTSAGLSYFAAGRTFLVYPLLIHLNRVLLCLGHLVRSVTGNRTGRASDTVRAGATGRAHHFFIAPGRYHDQLGDTIDRMASSLRVNEYAEHQHAE